MSTPDDEEADFTNQLKSGVPVMLHVKVGKLEPGSIQLVDEENEKLVIKTLREGWCSWCYCYNRRYELSPGQLEPVENRTHTMRLNRSTVLLNGGDSHNTASMLRRSLSLLRRHPHPESIDLTFATPKLEESLRLWVHKRLAVVNPASSLPRESSKRVVQALQGLRPSEDSDVETAYSEEQPTPRDLRRSGSAKIWPAQGHLVKRQSSRKAFKSESEQWDRRPSARSVGSTIPEGKGSGSSGGEDGGGASDGSDKAAWAWKAPPVLRRLSVSSNRSSRGGAAVVSPPPPDTAAGSSSVDNADMASGTSAAPLPPSVGSLPPSRCSSLTIGAAAAPAAGKREPERVRSSSDSGARGGDFWDPLGLMNDATLDTPPVKKTLPRRGSARRGRAPQSTTSTAAADDDADAAPAAAPAAGRAPATTAAAGGGRGAGGGDRKDRTLPPQGSKKKKKLSQGKAAAKKAPKVTVETDNKE
ncbi:hypothetical protein Esi_0145_0032 [Ectocarpus siliculosus]|uniref:Uncharacterized protein n=1 Tax=Ectocarpus siliculosus TaxID=2880 RepID=D8LF97_ECTSI|nr:hypothetical protein Esi_0145_0032 [Ectocarpus siliculosus]|eukprot:CBN78822.1 hypothetical protein Esi_0145_0032 [Ectocarpus siliculosus]